MFKKLKKENDLVLSIRIREERYRSNKRACDLFVEKYISNRLDAIYNDKYIIEVKPNIIHFQDILDADTSHIMIFIKFRKTVRSMFGLNEATEKICSLRIDFSKGRPEIETTSLIEYDRFVEHSEELKDIFTNIEYILKNLPVQIKDLMAKSDRDLISYMYEYMFDKI